MGSGSARARFDRAITERRSTPERAKDRRKISATAPLDGSKDLSLSAFVKRYITDHASTSGKKTWKNDEHMLNQLCAFARKDVAPLGETKVASITEDDLEAFFANLRSKGRAASTCNQYVQVLKAAFRWAAKKGYVAKSPITDDSTLKRRKIAQRARRLVADVLDEKGQIKEAGEERRLLTATEKNPGMQRLIIAALETGCRRGELLALTWADVSLERGELLVRRSKTGTASVLPITARLAAVLEMAKVDPAGKEYKSTGVRVWCARRADRQSQTRVGNRGAEGPRLYPSLAPRHARSRVTGEA